MSQRLIHSLLLSFLVFLSGQTLAQRPLTLLCNQYPPFTQSTDQSKFARDSQIIGIHADAMRALMQRADVEYTLTLRFPYQRLLTITQKKANTALFTVDRTPEREPHYLWVGPLDQQRWVIFSPSGKVPPVSNLNALTGKTVVTQKGEAIEATLRAKGIKVISATNNFEALSFLFDEDKADLWAVSERPGRYLAEQQGHKVKKVIELSSAPLYLALNKDSDPAIVARLQQTLEAMQADGSWQKLIEVQP